MFSRNKRQQQSAPIQPPIRPAPKDPVADAGSTNSSETRAPLSTAGALKPLSTAGERPRSGLDQFSFTPSSTSTTRRDGSFLASDLKIDGNVTSQGSLALDGQIVGDVVVATFELGSGGVVDGTVRAKKVEISGMVNGSIVANDVALMSTARVNGDIEHAALSIESGAELNGAVRRSDNPLGDDEASLDAKNETDDQAPSAAIELGSAAMLASADDAPNDATQSAAPLTAKDDDVVVSAKKTAKGKGKTQATKS